MKSRLHDIIALSAPLSRCNVSLHRSQVRTYPTLLRSLAHVIRQERVSHLAYRRLLPTPYLTRSITTRQQLFFGGHPVKKLARPSQTASFLPCSSLPLQSSFEYTLLTVAAIIATGVLASSLLSGHSQPSNAAFITASQEESENMALDIAEGRPGNLTAEQEEKLRRLWHALFQLFGVIDSEEEASTGVQAAQDAGQHPETEPQKKKRFGMFRSKKGNDVKAGTSSPSTVDVAVANEDDKYGQTKQYHEALAKHSPEAIRETVWAMVKHDHPDALALRFLRARKWDVDKALVMMVSTMNWRHSEMHVDDEVMKNGEAGAVSDSSSDDESTKKLGNDFMAQIRMGKSFLHGTDNKGRPICIVRVRFHKQGEQCEESLEKYTVYLIETARMVLNPPVDTAVSFITLFNALGCTNR
jgi:hypothetical protein